MYAQFRGGGGRINSLRAAATDLTLTADAQTKETGPFPSLSPFGASRINTRLADDAARPLPPSFRPSPTPASLACLLTWLWPPVMLLSAVGFLSVVLATAAAHTDDPPAGFMVAFVGDTPLSFIGDNPLFTMLRSSGVQMIVHSGDLSYSWDQKRIFATLKKVMGSPFPFVAALGNHDLNRFALGFGSSVPWVEVYASLLRDQATEAGVACTGQAGTFEKCYYNGIVVVNIAYKLANGLKPKTYANFINDAFREHPNAYWRH
ncbi:MAG: hypothetical protein BJ554DRAFT_284, partial [Olpidium bornovanus]